jgi:hypothetical protein
MVTITIQRRAKLEKAMGMGEGRMVEGQIVHQWADSATVISAKELGLRAITTLHLTLGTILTGTGGTPGPSARILSPGSFDNTVRILAPRTGSYPLNFIAVGQ